jgi:hypothetical protein
MDMNGSKQIAMIRTVIPQPNGAKIVYTTSQGGYVGTVVFDASSPDALSALGNDFQAFCAQQTGGIQVAPPGSLAGLKLSS